MGLITEAVGQGGRNNSKDVQVVEFLLNRVLTLIYQNSGGVQNGKVVFDDALTAFPVDGKIDDVVVGVIKDFQRNVLGFKWPDGRVDPNKNSIKALGRIFAQQGGVIPLNPAEAAKKADPSASYERKYGALYQTGTFKSGQIVAGLDGSRLILNISGHETVFLLLDEAGPGHELKDQNPMRGKPGTVYKQETAAFFDERDSMFFHDLAKRLKGVQALIELELGIMLAVVSASGAAGFVIVTGASGLNFVIENHKKFPAWGAAVAALLATRSTLKKHTPTLYEKLVKGLFIGVKSSTLAALGFAGPDVIGNIPAAMVKDPMTAGKLIGALLANLEKASLAKRLTLFGAVFSVVKTLAVKAAMGVPGAIGITVPEKLKSAREIVQHLQASGVTISEAEAKKIVDEVAANAKEVKDTLENLAKAFQQL